MLRLRHLALSVSALWLISAVGCSGDEDTKDGNEQGNGDTGDGDGDGDGDMGDGDMGDGDMGDGDGDGDMGDGDMGAGGMPSDAEVFFNRIAVFPVCEQLDPNCNDDTETVAEIVAVTPDNETLVYTDAETEVIGMVDISDASAPSAAGTVALPGEPTSVAIKGNHALVGVNTSASFTNPSGSLVVIDTDTGSETPVATIDVGGQPDSVAISPDGDYIAVVIENERDEDFDPDGLDGGLPQLPAGALVVIDSSDADPTNWTPTTVDLTGLTGAVEPTDPEPEYVDINGDNVAVVTLQENNAIALVDLATATVTGSFSAGDVDLTNIDATEEDPAIISLSESQMDVPREPDGVAWIDSDHFATADEGDWNGGSRGFTIFNTDGTVVFSSGAEMDHWAVALGHYPDGRSGNKGNEPENVEYAEFGDEKLLFVNSERSSLVFVYEVSDVNSPVLKQVLPTGVGPEGGLAIPSRNLLVVASEVDERDAKIRSVVNIYELGEETASYPTLMSEVDGGDTIAWSALSGLAVGGGNVYSIEDSFYGANRIFTIDASSSPAIVTDAMTIMDTNDVFAGITVDDVTDDDDAFSSADLGGMINVDKSVNIDPEGIAVADGGGFWVASEGNGTVGLQDDGEGNDDRPINSLNFIFKVSDAGVIEDVITLPTAINDKQLRFGFEGVTEYDGKLYVAFQRTWDGDTANKVRIGIYDITGETWEFVFYTIDTPTSQNGGWVGLSDIASVGDGTFLVIERDNQGGPDASIKQITQIDLSTYTDGADVAKTVVRDLTSDLASANGLTYEKIEGLALDGDGNAWIVNDNDGVDDNSGETQLMNLGNILN